MFAFALAHPHWTLSAEDIEKGGGGSKKEGSECVCVRCQMREGEKKRGRHWRGGVSAHEDREMHRSSIIGSQDAQLACIDLPAYRRGRRRKAGEPQVASSVSQ